VRSAKKEDRCHVLATSTDSLGTNFDAKGSWFYSIGHHRQFGPSCPCEKVKIWLWDLATVLQLADREVADLENVLEGKLYIMKGHFGQYRLF